jgi:nucleotide-binding universal stress UspA family protein
MGETIVVGFDGKEASGKALDRAIETVKASGGKVVVVVVDYEPIDPGVPSLVNFDPITPSEPRPLVGNEPTPYVEAIIEVAEKRVDAAGVEGAFVWAYGDPGRIIVDAARDNAADKIMIGPDHYGLVGRAFGDDIEDEVKDETDVEVVVVE